MSKYFLTITQVKILRELNITPLRFGEIKDRISIKDPSLTVALRYLYNKKLIEREPFHSGRYFVSVKGKKLIEIIIECELL